MPAALDRIAEAARSLVADASGWDAIKRVLTRTHTASYIVGVQERTGVMPQGLSRDERKDVKAILKAQFERLDAFAAEAESLSEAQVAARTDMYAGAVTASYWTGWAGEELECVPGSCPDCWSNCRCELTREDGGIGWSCAADDASCASCVERGNTWPL
jgi:hypothetical protein